MLTFLLGLAVLAIGGYLYGKFCESVFQPDNRATPAVAMRDDVNYVPMKKWRNSLIQLLNIAGTGPILGPIQGIIFGPIAFILIPVGCVLGGAMHDYFSGMISLRHKGDQMPALINNFLGKGAYRIYSVFVCLLMLLVGVAFIYAPGDMFLGSILGVSTLITDESGAVLSLSALAPIIVVYALILVYYLIATLFPIDKIIGRVYPIFGGILLFSAVGIFLGLFFMGGIFELNELWGSWPSWVSLDNIVPLFFVTVTCGIVSGFHSTQACIVARSVNSESEGRSTFYNMMILEGFVAMVWAAAAMVVYNTAAAEVGVTGTVTVVEIVAKSFLGEVGGIIAILGVIVLAISTGDTALRSLRLMIADAFGIDQKSKIKRVSLALLIFTLVTIILTYAKLDPDGFNVLWRYVAFANETCAVFAFALITIYLYGKRKPWIIALIPGSFYMFIVSSYLLNASMGFGLEWTYAYVIAGILTAAYAALLIRAGKIRKSKLESGEIDTNLIETPALSEEK